MDTFSDNDDVQERLDIHPDQYDYKEDSITSVRERAYRWIVSEFAKYGEEPPSEADGVFIILKDIEADRAAYYYWRDYQEWTTGDDEGTRRYNWKSDSKKMLEQLLRSKYGGITYKTGDKLRGD